VAPVLLIVALVGSAAGFMFAAVATYDFVAHLDRQVHGLHCSFIPGMGTPDVTGTSGCHVTLMSPYSSIWRDSVWGGVPISLPAMAVFAFLFFWGALIWLNDRRRDPRATGFYALAAALPAFTSIVMGIISLRELDALCKLCMGIYISSALVLTGAVGLAVSARGEKTMSEGQGQNSGEREPMSLGALVIAFVVGCVFVGASVVAYAASAPEFDKYVGSCGKLAKPADSSGALVTIGSSTGSVQILEVLDPLCPACRAFERRFSELELSEQASRKALLFPLDNKCNWMVDTAVHPGACAISEAMLCAGDKAEEVLEWAFDEQEALTSAERATPGSAEKAVVERFPALAGCVGSSKARARLNRSLRWAVDNQLPVLTPQLYVNGTRLCDADTDLGLDFMLTQLVEKASAGR
jgi:protein-disulfide isomerase